jgi:hypothetical protein
MSRIVQALDKYLIPDLANIVVDYLVPSKDQQKEKMNKVISLIEVSIGGTLLSQSPVCYYCNRVEMINLNINHICKKEFDSLLRFVHESDDFLRYIKEHEGRVVVNNPESIIETREDIEYAIKRIMRLSRRWFNVPSEYKQVIEKNIALHNILV